MSWRWRISTSSPARCCPSGCATAWANPCRQPREGNDEPRADGRRMAGRCSHPRAVGGRGAGAALHGPWGLAWDPFLDDLARTFTVYAPEHPGTTPQAHDDIYRLDGLWDLILCYDELLTAL